MLRLHHLLAAVMVMSTASSDNIQADLNSEALRGKMRELARNVVGKDYIQQLVDTESTFVAKKILASQDQGESFAKEV